MRKIIVLMAIAFTFLAKVNAQTDAKAKSILAAVSKKYRSYDVVKTGFTLTVESPQAKISERKTGTLFVKANANKYKVSMEDQDMISDGKSQWTYLKEDKEVQVTDLDNSADAINPAKIFTIFEKGFKYLYISDKKIGSKVYQIVDLTPLDTKRPYFKIRLSIDKTAKQIANVLIFNKNGDKYTYAITSMLPNVKVPETTFAFDAKKYPGVEVVDLR